MTSVNDTLEEAIPGSILEAILVEVQEMHTGMIAVEANVELLRGSFLELSQEVSLIIQRLDEQSRRLVAVRATPVPQAGRR